MKNLENNKSSINKKNYNKNQMNFRRSRFILFSIDDPQASVKNRLFWDYISTKIHLKIYCISILTGIEIPITADELRILISIPRDEWISKSDALLMSQTTISKLIRLAKNGLLLCDIDEPDLVQYKKRDEKLENTEWNVYAAFYHFMYKWQDVDQNAQLPVQEEELSEPNIDPNGLYQELLDQFGKPPTEFYSIKNATKKTDLPLIERTSSFIKLLEKRKTTRAFDKSTPLPLNDLSHILYWVFGCQGICKVLEGFNCLKKTSPSGGSLHPTEIYLLILNVTGIKCGLYHYNVQNH
jgi:hypothetical protein